jgi:hypothetical protein
MAGILLAISYIAHELGEKSPQPSDLRSWATAMLAFSGFGVVALIVIQILFHFAAGIAVRQRENGDKRVERIIAFDMAEDERDKLILLKSSHAGYICAGIGFMSALAALAIGATSVAALHSLERSPLALFWRGL